MYKFIKVLHGRGRDTTFYIPFTKRWSEDEILETANFIKSLKYGESVELDVVDEDGKSIGDLWIMTGPYSVEDEGEYFWYKDLSNHKERGLSDILRYFDQSFDILEEES